MNYYHICTEGCKDRVIFRDEEDYRIAMNYIAITCMERKIRLLAFCIMSNHFHFIVNSDYQSAKHFITSVKRRCSMFLSRKYLEPKMLSTKKHPVSIVEIGDLEYLKNAIAYVLRNPFKNIGELVWQYPWSSIGAYFSDSWHLNDRRKSPKGHKISKRKMKKALKSHFDTGNPEIRTNDTGNPGIRMDETGIVPPETYVDYRNVESVYTTAKSMSYFLNRDKADLLETELTSSGHKILYSDSKIMELLPEILYTNFGTGNIETIDMKHRYRLAGILRKKFNSPPGQIARITNLDKDIVSAIT